MKLKILTLNTWLVPLLSQYPEERGKKIAAFIKKEGFDFVFLQEVSSLKLRNLILSLLPQYQAATFPSQPAGDGLITLSRHPLGEKKSFRFSNCFHWAYPLSLIDQTAGKGFLITEAKVKKKPFLLINTHLNTVYDLGKGIENKIVSRIHLDQLKTIIKTLSSYHQNRPLILGGDFNFLPQSRPHRYLSSFFLTPSPAKNPFFTKDKENSWWPLVVPFGSPHQGYQIDYLFLDKNHPWKTTPPQLVLKRKYFIHRKKLHLSDHYGLSLTVSLP